MENSKELGVAVSVQRAVKSASKVSNCMEFVLAWDMPVVHFGDCKRNYKRLLHCRICSIFPISFRKRLLERSYRRYTRFFGSDGKAISALCSHGLNSHYLWEKKIEEWQLPILSHP